MHKRQRRIHDLLVPYHHDKDQSIVDTLARTCKGGASAPPRQMISDMKWEGSEWMSPAELAKIAAKRLPCPGGGGAGAAAVTGAAAAATTATADPECDFAADVVDCDDAGEACKERKRDKDRVPSKFILVKTGEGTWERQLRPRAFTHGIFWAYADIPHKQRDLLGVMLADTLTPVDKDFLRTHLVGRLNRTHPVSLRLLDWLVVDYARAKNVAYNRYVPQLGRHEIVVVHKLYTAWLRRWRRRHFDPFRRRHRIYFELDGATYSTTVAQLHFFYMASMYGFLDYAAQHLPDILLHMTTTTAQSLAAKALAAAEGRQLPRKPLVTQARSEAFVSEGTFLLTFGREGDSGATTDSDADSDADADADADAAVEPATRPTAACVDVLFKD